MFKKIIFGFLNQIYSIFLTMKNIFKTRETRLYPEHPIYLPPRYRGRIILTKDPDGNDRCVACNLCSVVCPVSCISIQKSKTTSGRWMPKFFKINFSRCIFCGLCEEACPTAAIQLIPEFELSEFNRKDLIYEKKNLSISGSGKYSDYSFYKRSGVYVKGDKKKDINMYATPINVKDLLP